LKDIFKKTDSNLQNALFRARLNRFHAFCTTFSGQLGSPKINMPKKTHLRQVFSAEQTKVSLNHNDGTASIRSQSFHLDAKNGCTQKMSRPLLVRP